jgi:tetratricopeptide (TPR) repeat protein
MILSNKLGDFMGSFIQIKKFTFNLSVCFTLLLIFSVFAFAQSPKQIERARKITQEAFADFNKGKYQSTIEKCNKALEVVPKFAYANYLKGWALFRQGKHLLALDALNLGMEQGHAPAQVYSVRGQVNLAMKNFTEAEADINQAVKLAPNDALLRRILGDIYYESKNYKMALTEYQEAVRLEPNYKENGDIYYLIAACYSQNRNLPEQGKYASLAIQNKTRYQIESYFLAGEAFQAYRRYDEAIVAFNEVVRLNPSYTDIYLRLSEIYLNQYRLDDAAEITRKGIATSPNEGLFYINLGWIYSLSNRHQEAVTVAQEGIRLQSDNYMGYTNICRAYNDLKKFDLAIQNCNKALELKPNDGETLFYLARANEGLNKTKEAATFYSRAVIGLAQYAKGRSDSFEVLYLLGNAYYATDKFNDAIRSYEKSLEICPNFPKARYNLALNYLKLNRVQDARKQYDWLLKLDTDLASKLKARLN